MEGIFLRDNDEKGLSTREAEKRLSIYGKNELEEKKNPSVLCRFIGQFMDPLIYVLLAAGVISILLGEQGDAVIIAAVVLLNAAVGVAQEGNAQKALDSLKEMTKMKAVVRRDGRLRVILWCSASGSRFRRIFGLFLRKI